jgi:hypothetical protein
VLLTLLHSLPLWALGGLTVGCCVLFAVAFATVAHRSGWLFDAEDISSATVLHALVSIIYAVALGLIVASVQSDLSEVRHQTVREATALGDLYRDLDGVDAAPRDAIRAQIAHYVRTVIDDEWPARRAGLESEAAEREIDALASRVIMLRVPDGAVVHKTLIDEVNAAIEARRERLFIGTDGINRATWAVVILGAMVAIGFGCLFPMQLRQRRVVVGLVATMFGLMLFLIVATDLPLRGQMAVVDSAFRELSAEIGSGTGR